MALEVEIKLALQGGGKEIFCAHPVVTGARAKGEKRVISTYYDTPDYQLRKGKIGFRVRQNGDRWVQTVKGMGKQVGGLSTRSEHETDISGNAPELDKLAGSPFEGLIRSVAGNIAPVFVTDFQRQKWIVARGETQIEMVLDDGVVHDNNTRLPILEIELELLSGNTETMLEVAVELASGVDFVSEPLSKAARGYGLNQFKAGPTPLTLPEAGEPDAVAGAFLEQINTALVLARHDQPEEGVARLATILKALSEKASGSSDEFWQKQANRAAAIAEAARKKTMTPKDWGDLTRLQLAMLQRARTSS